MGVTVVAVLATLEALLLVVVGAALLVAAGRDGLQVAVEAGAGSLRAGGAILAAVGVAEGILAALLARGSARARAVFGALNTVHVASAVYGLAALRELRFQSVWALALPVAVLWFLYGSDEVAEFFER